jgi:DeoR family glycerol-3-phosphate regulon repressor
MVQLAPLGDIDRLFTDAEPPELFTPLMAQAGVECVIAN